MVKPLLFLLAEDDEDDQMLFLEALKDINPSIECLMAKNGKEALQLLQTDLFSPPDYVFLDLNMPVMNGLACLRAIKQDPKLEKIRVIVYSTTVSDEFAQESKKAGAYSIFKKPDDFSGLQHYLRELFT